MMSHDVLPIGFRWFLSLLITWSTPF
jgi:hypothetical protein